MLCTPASSSTEKNLQTNDCDEKCAGIGLIYPPQTVKKWGVGRIIEWLWLKFADIFCPRNDEECSMEVSWARIRAHVSKRDADGEF